MSALACTTDASLPDGADPGPEDRDDETAESVDGKRTDAAPGKPIDGGQATPLDAEAVRGTDARVDPVMPVEAMPDAALSFDASLAPDAAADAGPVVTDIEFKACVAELKKGCTDDDREVGCASVKTPSIPLTDGGSWGGKIVQGGPYGALVEWNRGANFANTLSTLESSCRTLAASFGEPDAVTEDLLDLGGTKLELYTVVRPACMKEGETYPVITWGNGTCGQTRGYAALLTTLASHGYVVIAANSRFTDGSTKVMLRALDFAEAASEDEASSLYHRLDLTKVGAMGHSQGANATSSASADSRIKSLILWNGGGTNAKPFLLVSGERDIGNPSLASVTARVRNSVQPGAWLYYHKVLQTGGSVTGHLTLMEQPERVTDVAVGWWDYMLKGDPEAKKMFLGTDCGLCNMKADYDYGHDNLK